MPPTLFSIFFQLMMKQADTGKAHSHTVFVARVDYIVVADRTARLRHIFHAALVRPLNIVSKWEEGVGA